MKVIEHGRVAQCPDCYCKMLWDLNDVKRDEGDGPHPAYDYIVCPDCGRRIQIKK